MEELIFGILRYIDLAKTNSEAHEGSFSRKQTEFHL